MSNSYQCSLCGRKFTHTITHKTHVKTCGTEELTNYDFKQFNSQFNRLKALNKKLEDTKTNITDRKVTQRNLRNHKVRQQKLESFQ